MAAMAQCQRRMSSLPSLTEGPSKRRTKTEAISKAMQSYLQRAKQHDTFMASQTAEYEMGRRHLANMMGVDQDSFTQTEIDSAIEYLMPSGLFEKKARPQLKHPEYVFPATKAVQFGVDGRPFHYMFYTGMPQFYEVMHQASLKLEELKKAEDEVLCKGENPEDLGQELNIRGSVWLTHQEMKTLTLENMALVEYTRFIAIMERLVSHPLASRFKDFVMPYRKPLTTQALTDEILPPQVDENGREFSEATGERKSAEATAQIWTNGGGEITVNGVDKLYEYFPRFLDRLQLMTPLQFTGMLGRVDIVATVRSGGPSGQAGALRLAIARALCSFVEPEMVERMRLAGLLTKDPRRRERKKPGREGARRKFAW